MRVAANFMARGVVPRCKWSLAASAVTIATWALGASVAEAAPPNTMPIWRLQVRFLTADVGDAGTDSSVKVQLNAGNATWLDSGRDDRERNTDETFDLRAEGINTLADIDFFRVEKDGDDGWAIRQMELIVNGVPIYVESFSNSQPLWLDNEDGHFRVFVNDDSFMRVRPEWLNYPVPTRSNVVPVRDMELRVEALTGDELNDSGTDLINGNDAVEMFTMTTNTWRVDLDVEDQKQWPFPDLEFDVDFDLSVGCEGGRATFAVANVNSDAGWPEDDTVSGFVAFSLAPRLNEMMKNYTFGWCPSIALASNGDLHFNRRLPPWGDLPLFELVDTLAPIGLHVSTGGPTKYDSKATFVATVKSTLKRDEKVELSFELPAQVTLAAPVIEVQTAKERYRVEVKLEQRDDGSARVAFVDGLMAGALTRYTLPVIYKPSKETSGQIKTAIYPLDEETAAQVTALESLTRFEFRSDLVVPVATSTRNARYVEDVKEEARE